MPTILIEIAMRGMAVVASQVGGIPELIDEATGWPVRAVEDVDAYVAALRAALAGPVLRIARARPVDPEWLLAFVRTLEERNDQGDDATRRMLHRLVPEYAEPPRDRGPLPDAGGAAGLQRV